jgi:hypothetical protein
MSWVFDGDALKVALVLGCRPGRGVIGVRVAGQGFGALTRGFGVGVRPTAEILSFASPKESIQRKGDPGYAPSAFGCGFPALLESRGGCGTRFAQTVLADPPAPSCDARRSSREPVRGDAIYRATINGFSGGQLAVYLTQAELMLQRLHYSGQLPVESAEHRSLKRGSRRGLFEQQSAGLMRVPQPPFQARSAGNPQPKAEGANVGSPSLGYLSWRDKKGTVLAGHPRHLNQSRASAPNQPESQFSGRAPSPQPLSLQGRGAMTAPLQPTLLLLLKHACKPIPERLAGRYAKEARHA